MGNLEENSKEVAKAKKTWVFVLGGAIVAAFGTGWLARERLAEAAKDHELMAREIDHKESQAQLARVREDLEKKSQEVDRIDAALSSTYQLVEDLRQELSLGDKIQRAADPVALKVAIEIIRSELSATTLATEVELGQVKTELASWQKKAGELDMKTSGLQAELDTAKSAHVVEQQERVRLPEQGASGLQGLSEARSEPG